MCQAREIESLVHHRGSVPSYYSLRSVNIAELAIEGPEGKMPSLASELEKETVREAQRRPLDARLSQKNLAPDISGTTNVRLIRAGQSPPH
jgi:hypothetical protein